MDEKLIKVLSCPVCRSEIKYNSEKNEIICPECKRLYPVKDDVPVMLESEAKTEESM